MQCLCLGRPLLARRRQAVRKPIVSKAPVWKAATLAAVLGLAMVPYPAHAAPALRQLRTSPSRSGLSACSRGQWARAARRSRRTANSSAGTPNRAGRDRPRRYASPEALWQDVQAQTAPLSPKGRLAIVQGSRHSIKNDRGTW